MVGCAGRLGSMCSASGRREGAAGILVATGSDTGPPRVLLQALQRWPEGAQTAAPSATPVCLCGPYQVCSSVIWLLQFSEERFLLPHLAQADQLRTAGSSDMATVNSAVGMRGCTFGDASVSTVFVLLVNFARNPVCNLSV